MDDCRFFYVVGANFALCGEDDIWELVANECRTAVSHVFLPYGEREVSFFRESESDQVRGTKGTARVRRKWRWRVFYVTIVSRWWNLRVVHVECRANRLVWKLGVKILSFIEQYLNPEIQPTKCFTRLMNNRIIIRRQTPEFQDMGSSVTIKSIAVTYKDKFLYSNEPNQRTRGCSVV